MIDNDGDPMAAAPAGALILRADALDMGVNADDIKRRLERGHWVSVRPGAYLRATTDAALTPRQRHLLQINATMAAGGEHLVVSHRSAACLHGFDLLTIPGRIVDVTNGEAAAGRRTRLRHTYCAPLEPDEIVVLGGHRVTSPARTLVDLARSASFEEALVATDHALHHQRVSRDELRASMDRAPRRKGMRSARQVVVFADGRAESAGESRSRLLIARQLLPVPDLQVAIRTRNGVVVAHSDSAGRSTGRSASSTDSRNTVDRCGRARASAIGSTRRRSAKTSSASWAGTSSAGHRRSWTSRKRWRSGSVARWFGAASGSAPESVSTERVAPRG